MLSKKVSNTMCQGQNSLIEYTKAKSQKQEILRLKSLIVKTNAKNQ